MTDPVLSPLAAAIAARPRPVHAFPVSGFFHLGGSAIHAIGLRVAVKAEDDAAIVEAHKYAHDATRGAGEAGASARTDADLLTDAKTIEALFRVCRAVTLDPQAPEDMSLAKPTIYPAFPAPAWMRANLTTDQVAVLLNLYLETKRREAPAPPELSDEQIEALATMCGQHAGDSIPEAVLAGYPREFLTHAVVLLAVKLSEARLSVETLLQQHEALDAPTS